MKNYLLFVFFFITLVSCRQNPSSEKIASSDPLPSWNETANKKNIIQFVTETTTEGSSQFIPEENRIAVFDNDGTLWCEQPFYVEMIFSLDATKTIASKNTALLKNPAIKALVNGDKAAFFKAGEKAILEAFAISHAGVSPDQFNQLASAWLDTATHPKTKEKFVNMTYQPMVELLAYLQKNQYKTFIVSGGSAQFIRNFSRQAYNIPPEQVIGTMLKATYKDGEIHIEPHIWLNDDKAGKPEAIFQIIGQKPVLAFGNSDGDLQMLEWTSTQTLPHLSVYLHHTDGEREFAYDSLSHIGTLKEGLKEAAAKGWMVVDMKQDFRKIYSFEK